MLDEEALEMLEDLDLDEDIEDDVQREDKQRALNQDKNNHRM